jgi:hypothetical protein
MRIARTRALCMVALLPMAMVSPPAYPAALPLPSSLRATCSPVDDCPLTCLVDLFLITWDSDWVVLIQTPSSGTAKLQTCETCTECKALISWTYSGSRRWLVTTPSGQVGGVGPTFGVFSVSSTCDDLTPGGVAAEQGNPLSPGFVAQIYCPCIGD